MTIEAAYSISHLSDDVLLERLESLARKSEQLLAHLLAHLAETDARQLYLGLGYASMFTYCTEKLHFSEASAYRRIHVARAARRFPVIFSMIASGALHLTAVLLLSPVLTQENHHELLERATHKGKRAVETIVASVKPKPDVPAFIRKLPPPIAAPAPDSASQGRGTQELVLAAPAAPTEPISDRPPAQRAIPPTAATTRGPASHEISALAPERYKVQFTGSETLHEKLRMAIDLLGRPHNCDPADIFERALTVLVEQLVKKKFAATERPRPAGLTAPGSRHIPNEVKRQVYLRDGGRCAFVASDGKRCTETRHLHFHHREAFARGGLATTENVTLHCARHNQYQADLDFGPRLREPVTPYGDPDATVPPRGAQSCASAMPCLAPASTPLTLSGSCTPDPAAAPRTGRSTCSGASSPVRVWAREKRGAGETRGGPSPRLLKAPSHGARCQRTSPTLYRPAQPRRRD